MFKMLHVLKNIKKNIWDIFILHLCTKNLDDMTYSSWYTEHDRLKLVILGYFLLFYPPLPHTHTPTPPIETPKINNFT